MSVGNAENLGADEDPSCLRERAQALRQMLEHHRPAGDRQRRLPDETINALTAAGFFRTLVPRRFGGFESDLNTVIEATAEITKGDPAAGWVVMILGSADWLIGLYPEAAQREVYSESPDTRVCAVLTPHSTARRVDGGWLLNGRWAPSSGCLHAQWSLLGFPLSNEDGESTGIGLALVPISELHTEDTWFTVGMRATGSNLLIGEDVFAPDHRVLPLGPAVAGHHRRDRPARYRSALVPTLLTYMVAPYLGIASAALEYVVEQAGKRGVSFTHYERQSDSTAFQLAVAEAAAKVDVVRLLAYDSAHAVDAQGRAGTFPSYLERARIRLHTGHAVQQAREAVDSLVSAHGAAALSESNPLNVFMRDIHAASRHALANPTTNSEVFGRALLGVEPNITNLI
jgi:3-hydroxy-9,10-secoandrosta-1,3,5(10)-triene-9,17-dione monooxygenase